MGFEKRRSKKESLFLFKNNKANKRALVLTFEVLLLIILALAAIVVLSIAFSKSSGNLIDKIQSYFTDTNIDSVIQGCNILVDSGQTTAYCCEKKSVKYYENEEKQKGDFTCFELIGKNFVKGLKTMECDVGC